MITNYSNKLQVLGEMKTTEDHRGVEDTEEDLLTEVVEVKEVVVEEGEVEVEEVEETENQQFQKMILMLSLIDTEAK